MAEERNNDPKISVRRSVGLSDLARSSVSPVLGTRPAEMDVVVDLTGESDEEDTVDLTDTNSMMVEDIVDLTRTDSMIVSVERDGLHRGHREQVDLDNLNPSSGISPLREESPLPALSPQPVTTNNEDDVVIVSSYCTTRPACTRTHPVSSVSTPTSPSPASLAPHISHIITCPICMDTQKAFTLKGFSLVTTKCGHLFCDNCLKKAISMSRKCPTCFTKLTTKQFHRIYI